MMAIETTPYIGRNPGDLVTAEDWNELQRKIKADIGKQVGDAIKNLTTVQNSENTHKIDNQTADELTNAILEKAKQELPLRTGYLRLFKRVKTTEELVIKHNLAANPVVDLYQLDEFEVICSEDEIKSKTTALFYLYQTNEKKIRTKVDDAVPPATPGVQTAIIESDGETPFRIPFSEMLSLYKVSYNDNSSLDNLVTEFWEAFFAAPNDEFDDDKACRSPWFDKCCGDKRTVGELKQRDEWDDLWFKVMPGKTVNSDLSFPAPRLIQVRQFDLNTIGIKLLDDADGPDELPLMALLKV
jgi:hypothetical protein